MVESRSWGSRLFDVIIHLLLALLALACVVPMLHLLAVSLSDRAASQGGLVGLYPIRFTTGSYTRVLTSKPFLDAIIVSVKRTVVGTAIQMTMVVLAAYPLSKTSEVWRGRQLFMWIVLFAMLFSGGLIPNYLVVRRLGMFDSLAALVIPNALPIWSAIMMMNFFRETPRELEEAAVIDGASHFHLLGYVFLPLATPALATLTLFSAVNHWNAWFDGMIYIVTPMRTPLQTYLRRVAVVQDFSTLSSEDWMQFSERSVRAAHIFLTIVPILLIYPFLQRYFVTGIRLGAIKG